MFIWADEEIYEGEFEDGERNGEDRATMRTATTMKESGLMVFLMDRVSFSLKMVKAMTADGKREKPMDREFIFTRRSNMCREHGKKANSKNEHHD